MQIGRIRRIFKWAAAEEYLPAIVFQALKTLDPLKRSRTNAPEGRTVKPAKLELVNALLPHMSRPLAAMVRLQLATGMRPGEVCALRPCDIDRGGAIWNVAMRCRLSPALRRRAGESQRDWRARLAGPDNAVYKAWLRSNCFHPHQLRHNYATAVRRDFGLEAAQLTLGHASAAITDAVYAERDEAKVLEIAAKIG